MVDLGLYNYIQKELAEGKTKEEITLYLTGTNWNPQVIEDAWKAIEHGDKPEIKKVPKERGPNPLISLFILGALVVIAVLVILNYKKLPTFVSIFQTTQTPFVASNVPMYSYAENEINVSMNVPAGWQIAKDQAGDGGVAGFTATGNLSSNDTATAKLDESENTILLPGIELARRSAIGNYASVQVLKDVDLSIGGQPGHEFEFTYTVNGVIQHRLEGYVFYNGNLYTFSAEGLNSDWGQIPGLAMLTSIAFK